MFLHRQTVSRKTPNDGMLELNAEAAERLAALTGELRVSTGVEEAIGSLRSLPCTCGKGGEGTHVHHFLESPVLRGLTPGTDVRVELLGGEGVRVSLAD